jgi:hypothetical protein
VKRDSLRTLGSGQQNQNASYLARHLVDVTMQYLHDFAIQEPLDCLCSHSLAPGSCSRARKSLYEAPSVPGYASPQANSMRGRFFRFPLFCPFRSHERAPWPSSRLPETSDYQAFAPQTPVTIWPQTQQTFGGKVSGKTRRIAASSEPFSHLPSWTDQRGAWPPKTVLPIGVAHRCYRASQLANVHLVDCVCRPWTSPLISPASY